MATNKDNTLYTLYTEDLINITLQSHEQLDNLLDMVQDLIELERNTKNHYVFSLVCELIWVNNSMLLALKKEFEEPVFKDESQKEVFILKKTLDVVTALMLSKTSATSELNRFSYSVSLH